MECTEGLGVKNSKQIIWYEIVAFHLLTSKLWYIWIMNQMKKIFCLRQSMIIYYDHYALYLIFFQFCLWSPYEKHSLKWYAANKLKKNLFYLYGKLNHILEEANDAIVVKPRPLTHLRLLHNHMKHDSIGSYWWIMIMVYVGVQFPQHQVAT